MESGGSIYHSPLVQVSLDASCENLAVNWDINAKFVGNILQEQA